MVRTAIETSDLFYEQVLNAHDLDAIDDLVAEDYVELDPQQGQAAGRNGLRQALAEFNEAFPDNHWHLDERIVDGEKIVTRFHWTGTHTGEFRGVPQPTRAHRLRVSLSTSSRTARWPEAAS